MEERATSITANREAMEMTVIWADGHISNYPFSLLRAACPCAQCRGGHENNWHYLRALCPCPVCRKQTKKVSS
jgi:DUF971 family protein